MKIKTKFDVGEVVFFYKEGVLGSKVITGINASFDTRNHLFITYDLEHEIKLSEEELFESPEDFFKHVKIVELQ